MAKNNFSVFSAETLFFKKTTIILCCLTVKHSKEALLNQNWVDYQVFILSYEINEIIFFRDKRDAHFLHFNYTVRLQGPN